MVKWVLEVTPRWVLRLGNCRKGNLKKQQVDKYSKYAWSLTFLPQNKVENVEKSIGLIRNHGFGEDLAVHLPARKFETRDDINGFLQKNQIRKGFVIAGDAPVAKCKDMKNSFEVLKHLSENKNEVSLLSSIGIAGYPDGHSKIPDEQLDDSITEKIKFLEKQNHISSFVVTQLVQNPSSIMSWTHRIGNHLSTELELNDSTKRIPIYIGVFGPVEQAKLIKMSRRLSFSKSAEDFLIENSESVADISSKLIQNVIKNENEIISWPFKLAGFHISTFDDVERSLEFIEKQDRLLKLLSNSF